MTDHPSPAEVLTAAADRLDTLVADPDLTPGPWLSLDHGDRLLYNGPGAEDAPPVYVVDEPMSNAANAAWIEAMHPGVGRALATWLRREAMGAADVEAYLGDEFQDGALDQTTHDALAVARQILNTREPQ